MPGRADSFELTLTCPKCDKKLKEKLGRLSRDKRITCPTCGPIEITGDGLAKIKAALRQFDAVLPKRRVIKL